MNSWEDVKDYITGKYTYEEADENTLAIDFDVGNGRGQSIFIDNVGMIDGRQYITFISPVGVCTDPLLLQKALKISWGWVLGGLIMFEEDNSMFVRNVCRIESLSELTFENNLNAILHLADTIEDNVLGIDEA